MTTLLGILLTFATTLSAAPYSISSENLPPVPPGTEASVLLLRLKQQAVREYLQRILGPRYDRYDQLVTVKFAEDYILDYQVVRQSPDSSQMEISVNLDVDALRQWVRVNETKASGGATLKPLFLLSASIPGYLIDPKQTAIQIKQSALGQTVHKELSNVFQKFNAALLVTEDLSLALSRPPAGTSEMQSLRSFGGRTGCNSSVWAHLSSQNGKTITAELHLYNLTQSRQVETVSADTELSVADLGDAKKIAKALSKTISEFGTRFEESVSKGTLFALEYRFIVEGIQSYRVFKQIDAALGKQDFVLGSSLARSSSTVAEFRLLSTLQPKDLFQRLHITQFPGMTLKPVRIDSQVVTMRYLN